MFFVGLTIFFATISVDARDFLEEIATHYGEVFWTGDGRTHAHTHTHTRWTHTHHTL